MSVRFYTYHEIKCEFCPSTFGSVGQYSDAVSIRRAALQAGWRLLPKTLKSGRRGKTIDVSDDRRLAGASTTNYDVCPACHPCETCNGKPPAGFTCNTCATNGAIA